MRCVKDKFDVRLGGSGPLAWVHIRIRTARRHFLVRSHDAG